MGSLGWEQCTFCPRWGDGYYIPDGIGGPLCPECLDNENCRAPYPSRMEMAWIRLKSTGKRFLEADVLVKIAEFQHGVFELGTLDPLYKQPAMSHKSTQELFTGYGPQQMKKNKKKRSALYEMD